MTIEIDDSGTGDLVGNAFIGFLRKESGELIFRTLSLDLFKGENWKNKEPLKVTVELVKDGLKELKFQKDDEIIKLCRGNIFDEVRAYFVEKGINFEVDYFRNELGIRSKNLTKRSGAKRFFILFNWLCYDFYNREIYVKSGFKKWNTVWRDRAIEKYEKIKKRKKTRYNKY
jgi:hypothetical protein